jgi:3',5'-cyclic AMP phosphodiesterase CpdA
MTDAARCFAHFSDPHLTTLPPRWEEVPLGPSPNRLKRRLGYLSWQRRRRLEHRREVLDLITARIREAAPLQILLTGDLTHIGLESEFREAATWLQDLAPPEQLALVPGNHDASAAECRDLQRRYWASYLRGDAAQSATDDTGWPSLRVRGDIAFIGLNSAVVTAPLLATGRVGAEQRSALASQLRACGEAGLFRVVCVHHCPLPGIDKWRKRLMDGGPLTEVLGEAGVELVLHGHGHRHHCHSLATGGGPVPVIAAGSASARGRDGREGASCNLFQLRGSAARGFQLELTRWALDARGERLHPEPARSWDYPERTSV